MYDINLPAVVAEVQAECERYEVALTQNLVDQLDAFFLDSPATMRYGATENLYGYAAIQAFRAQRPAKGLARTVLRREVSSYGQDMAVSHLEFMKSSSARIGRQTQTWVRRPDGWRIVSAHVSWMD